MSEFYEVEIFVQRREGVLNPPAKTITEILRGPLGFDGLNDLELGKYFRLVMMADSTEGAKVQAEGWVRNPQVFDPELVSFNLDRWRVEARPLRDIESKALE